MRMRGSRILRKIRAGRTAICTKINLNDPRVVEIAGLCGFDCVWLDMEHVPSDWMQVENMVRAAKIYNMDTLVRVEKGSYSDMIRPLEADATGIMVPHLMSLKEAREIVYYTKFHPIGRRPLDGGNADGAYCLIPLKDYLREANRERFICVQIEDPEPLGELDKIAALKGIDMIFFGPGDFSQGIKQPGNFNHPEISRIRKKVAQAARRHHKIAATVGSPGNLCQLVKEGFQFINMGADVLGLSAYYHTIFKKSNIRKSVYGR